MAIYPGAKTGRAGLIDALERMRQRLLDHPCDLPHRLEDWISVMMGDDPWLEELAETIAAMAEKKLLPPDGLN
jgi:hypothetical protein